MKKFFYALCIMMVLVTALSSCKNNTPREAKYIPKEASFVLTVDPQQMQDKLQKGGISIDTLLKKIFKDTSDLKDKTKFNALRDSSGIDWNAKLFVFMVQKSFADNSLSNAINVMGSIKDGAKLETYIKSQDELKTKEIKKEKDFSYISFSDGLMLSWNDQQVIATMYTHTQKPVYDTVAMTFKRPNPADITAELKTAVSHYFTQKSNESLADNSIFTDLFKEKADGYIFSSANSSLAGLSMLPFQIPKMEELLKDNFVTGTLSFEDGKIIAKSTSYTNELLGSVLKQYAGPTVNLSMIENYPSQNINAIILAAFNPEIFGGILKQLEVEGLANNALEKIGFTTQDLYKSLKGDIAVVVSDFDITSKEPQFKTDETSLAKKKPFGKMILTAPVGDKVSFLKLMDKAVEHGFLKKQGTIYTAGNLFSYMGFYFIADEKNLTIASDSVTYSQYIAKTAKSAISKDALEKFKGKSTIFYLDIAGTLNGLSKDSTGSFARSLGRAKATFKDIIAGSDNFDGKNIKAQFELRLQNEKQNSLVTLTSLFSDIAVDMRLQAKKEREAEAKMFPGGYPAIIRTN